MAPSRIASSAAAATSVSGKTSISRSAWTNSRLPRLPMRASKSRRRCWSGSGSGRLIERAGLLLEERQTLRQFVIHGGEAQRLSFGALRIFGWLSAFATMAALTAISLICGQRPRSCLGLPAAPTSNGRPGDGGPYPLRRAIDTAVTSEAPCGLIVADCLSLCVRTSRRAVKPAPETLAKISAPGHLARAADLVDKPLTRTSRKP
jgi:hypothetical protein